MKTGLSHQAEAIDALEASGARAWLGPACASYHEMLLADATPILTTPIKTTAEFHAVNARLNALHDVYDWLVVEHEIADEIADEQTEPSARTLVEADAVLDILWRDICALRSRINERIGRKGNAHQRHAECRAGIVRHYARRKPTVRSV